MGDRDSLTKQYVTDWNSDVSEIKDKSVRTIGGAPLNLAQTEDLVFGITFYT